MNPTIQSSVTKTKRNARLYLPILTVFAANVALLGWAASASGQPVTQVITSFSGVVALLILLTGLLPAVARPHPSHTLLVCYSTLFAFLLLIPFEYSDLPRLRPGLTPLTTFDAYITLKFVQAALLLPLGIHLSTRFPRPMPTPTIKITVAYLLSMLLVALFLLSSSAWQHKLTLGLLFAWFIFAVTFALKNLLAVARDPSPSHLADAQRARIVFFSLSLAQIPFWLRLLTLIFGLDALPYNLVLAFQLIVPLGIAYAILRHDLFGIDRTLRRALLYGSLSLLILTLYLGLITSLTALFANLLTSRPMAPLISLFVAALLFDPTRKALQTWLDRLLYPDRLKFKSAVHDMQERLARVNRRDEIVHLLEEIFPQQIGSEWGALKLFPEPDVPPPRTSPAWHTCLIAGSVPVGSYWLGPRRAGPQFDRDEVNLLQSLSGQISLSLAYANAYEKLYELNRDLEVQVEAQTRQAIASQKAVVALEERQRIARDLHDSVTQQLFGLHLMARGLKASAPQNFKENLAALEQLASDTLKQMRLMLEQLRNDSGDEEVDFAEVVWSECEVFSRQSGPEGGALLSVAVEVPPSVMLPKHISEQARWFLREALQNVVKHSRGRTASVQVSADSFVHLSISDNGCGFDVNALPAGRYGLRGMRERVLALGGEVNIDSEIGHGTTVRCKIPLPSLEVS